MVKNKKDKSKGKRTILKKPKAKLPSVNPSKFIQSKVNHSLVKEGRTGYFNEEYEREIKWLA